MMETGKTHIDVDDELHEEEFEHLLNSFNEDVFELLAILFEDASRKTQEKIEEARESIKRKVIEKFGPMDTKSAISLLIKWRKQLKMLGITSARLIVILDKYGILDDI